MDSCEAVPPTEFNNGVSSIIEVVCRGNGMPISYDVKRRESIISGSKSEMFQECSLLRKENDETSKEIEESSEEIDESSEEINDNSKVHDIQDLEWKPDGAWKPFTKTKSFSNTQKASSRERGRKKKSKLQVPTPGPQCSQAKDVSEDQYTQQLVETVWPKKRGPGRPKKSESHLQNAKITQAKIQQDFRDRKNRSISILRKVVPGVSEKLDTAGVLEMTISYLLHLHKQVDQEAYEMEFINSEVSRKLGL